MQTEPFLIYPAAWTDDTEAPTIVGADQLHHFLRRRALGEDDAARAPVAPAGGTRHTLGAPWLIDGERPNGFRRAPRVGEDNEYIFKGLLRLGDAEYERLVAEQVIY